MRLSRRLLLVIGFCLMPMVLAFVVALVGLYEQRLRRADVYATSQLRQATADLVTIVDGARSMLLAVGQVAETPDCSRRLADLQRTLPIYGFLAVLDGSGAVLCGSRPNLAAGFAARPLALLPQAVPPGSVPPGDVPRGDVPPRDVPSENVSRGDVASGAPTPEGDASRFQVGTYVTLPGVPGAFLPLIVQRLPSPSGPARTIVAALDLDWLDQHIANFRASVGGALAGGSVLVLDRNGIILSRVPEPEKWRGRRATAAYRNLLFESHRGLLTLPDLDGLERLTAFDPATLPPEGLLLAVGLYRPALLADVRSTVLMGAALGSLALLAALAIGYWAIRRYVETPARRLLESVRFWRAGDLSARAAVDSETHEFGHLAEVFNEMAAALDARVGELAQQTEFLQTRVADRTRELSGSNNRLQVEIAERQRAEAVLHQAQKLQAVGQLAGGVAHDFNNLLATILGSLELIERRLPEPDERMQRLLTRATEAVQRGSQLTSRLLAFSRRQRLAARPTDLNHLVGDLVTLAGSTLGRRVRIETALAADLWPAMVDPSQLEAAILNLALNARDAMPQGGVLTLATQNHVVPPTPRPGVRDLPEGEYVQLSVADTGVGMSPDVQARAFEPFFTTKELGQGSGLGLSQVYGLAQQSDGSVLLSSEPGVGTTVTLLLPRAAVADADTDAGPARQAARWDRQGEPVMLVDDDPDVRQVTAEMLRDLGYAVTEASGGEEALALLAGLPRKPVLLVLDYAMPGMNGLQLAARLRTAGVTAPVLLATGYAELSSDRSGVTPDAILHKPFTLAEFGDTLARLQSTASASAPA